MTPTTTWYPADNSFRTLCTDKDRYMAVISMYFCLGNLAMTFFRAHNGFLTATVGKGFLAGLAGVFLGAKVFNRIPAKIFRYVVYAYIGICGIIILATR